MRDMRNCCPKPCYPGENLYAASFALDDLNLYLDTHPCDRAALEYFQELRREEAAEEARLEATGYNLTAASHCGTNRWTWVDGLWPWEGV